MAMNFWKKMCTERMPEEQHMAQAAQTTLRETKPSLTKKTFWGNLDG